MPDTAPPTWFIEAIESPRREFTVNHAGCDIACQAWGDPNNPGILLLHGNGAHANWWDFIAPSFAEDYYLVAFSLSGMGNSGHREDYRSTLYVEEIKTVCDNAGFSGKPLLVGHSLGGRLVLNAEKTYPAAFRGIVMVDSPFHPPDKEFKFAQRRAQPVKPHRIYPTQDAAVARFRLFPEQPCENTYIIDYIARYSVKSVQGGWQWKFDPKTYSRLDFENLLSSRPSAKDKILALIYGEQSELFPAKTVAYNQQLFADAGLPPPIKIANAHHHLFLDQPRRFIDTLRKVLQRD